MPSLTDSLLLNRCPYCQVDSPNLERKVNLPTTDFVGQNKKHWGVYVCKRCGGVVTAWANVSGGEVHGVYPKPISIGEAIPAKPKAFLEQAVNSYSAPSGAIMLAASAIDAMLKSRDYKDGSLYKRIDQAAKDHLITKGMAEWAHQVRLEANDERHADDNADLPTVEDAKRAVEFALALAEFLFVLPARVTRGITETKSGTKVEK